jgi:hypothetical protein
MKSVNKYFSVSDNAEYVLVSERVLNINGGVAEAYYGGVAMAYSGGRAEAYYGGRAMANYGGRAMAYNGGQAVAYNGGQAEAYYGGVAMAYKGGRAEAYNGGQAEAYNGGVVCKSFNLANDGAYQLWCTDDGYFYAGCQKRLTREQALAHWDRDDDRAMLFTLAILVCTE